MSLKPPWNCPKRINWDKWPEKCPCEDVENCILQKDE